MVGVLLHDGHGVAEEGGGEVGVFIGAQGLEKVRVELIEVENTVENVGVAQDRVTLRVVGAL